MTTLPAVVLAASKQKEKVQRLVNYCRQLDGTELRVLALPPEIDLVPHPVGVEHAIRWAAKQFSTPWIYLEADSIPLKPQWNEAITEEHFRIGKLFTLPSLEGTDFHDVASAIGVFPPNTADLLPTEFNKPPWFDLFIYKKLMEHVNFTKIIQHRYAFYQGSRVMRRPEFPHDRGIIRPEAVVFHADPTQSIIRGGLLQSFFHSGDFGDIIASLPIIKQQGGGRLLVGPHHTYIRGRTPRVMMNEARYQIIRPLLQAQPYLHFVEYSKNFRDADRDLSTFRHVDWNRTDNLAQWQARHIGRTELDTEPWLEVSNAPWHGRVVVSRSQRYHNPNFPWKKIIEKYGERLLFVGAIDEHAAFEKLAERKIERAQTDTLLDVARILAGAELQFSNQSAPWWIGAGLGKRIIQETWAAGEVNSIIKRDSLSYTRTPEELAALNVFLNE